MKPYVLMSPDLVGENTVSGGVKVMWALYGWLLAKGQLAYMNRVPQLDTIAIYPEIFHGNPANSKTVVRYILNKVGVMGANGVAGPTEFDKNDKIYVFSKLFDTFGCDDDHLMFLPAIDLHTFYDQKKKRTKKAVLIGKGIPTNAIDLNECVVIDRKFAQDQKALADLLNECQVLYSFDNVSAMFECARLCGCKVVVIPSIYTKDEFKKYEAGTYGVYWGLGEYLKDETEPFNSEIFRDKYVSMINTFSNKLDKFIEETQK